MNIVEACRGTLKRCNSPHLDHLYDGLELQVVPLSVEAPERINAAEKVFRIRLPKNGSVEPVDNNRQMPYSPALMDRFGTSGWNYKMLRTDFVVLDFDSKHGHASGLGDDELEQVMRQIAKLPYVWIFRSKSGKGYHVYVFLEQPSEAKKRSDHTLASHAIIAQMSKHAGIDILSKVDCHGVIGWLWSHDAAPNGFELVKAGTERFTMADNWREIAERSKQDRNRRKLGTKGAAMLKDMTAAGEGVELDDIHVRIIEWLLEHGWVCIVEVYNGTILIRTHTAGLAAAYVALGLRGVFQTTSAGSNPSEPNCFCFPSAGGRFTVRRFGTGVRESPLWLRTANGWTSCEFNADIDFLSAARALGGNPGVKNEVWFVDHTNFMHAMETLSLEVDVPERLRGKVVVVKRGEGGLEVTIESAETLRADDVPGWQ